MKKCIGIVSYFPGIEARFNARAQRIARFNNLLKQINSLWPNIDILIVAQNWQDYQLPEISNKTIIYRYDEPLTIIGARNTLRNKILTETDYDYIIMLDDDAIINDCSPEIAKAYLDEIEAHPNMFCFIHDVNHWHTCDDYIKAPLNLCAISRFIYEQEEFPQVCLEKNEALEDDLYAVLLHTKYAEHEFIPPTGIKCTHAVDGSQYLLQLIGRGFPSTWYNNQTNFIQIINTTNKYIREIIKNKDFKKE